MYLYTQIIYLPSSYDFLVVADTLQKKLITNSCKAAMFNRLIAYLCYVFRLRESRVIREQFPLL